MSKESILITQERFDELTRELEERKGSTRAQIGEALRSAKALGDLSENAEYHDARNKQGKNESRIQEIEEVLKQASIATKSDSGAIDIASTVTIKKKGDTTTLEFTLVGPEEADMSRGRLSTQSPLGEALFGKKKGDIAEVTTPSGTVTYTIVAVS